MKLQSYIKTFAKFLKFSSMTFALGYVTTPVGSISSIEWMQSDSITFLYF